MQQDSRERLTTFLGWLIFAVPVALLLLAVASISIAKLGVNGGIAFAAALAIWVGLLTYRWRRG